MTVGLYWFTVLKIPCLDHTLNTKGASTLFYLPLAEDYHGSSSLITQENPFQLKLQNIWLIRLQMGENGSSSYYTESSDSIISTSSSEWMENTTSQPHHPTRATQVDSQIHDPFRTRTPYLYCFASHSNEVPEKISWIGQEEPKRYQYGVHQPTSKESKGFELEFQRLPCINTIPWLRYSSEIL